ncbi:MAG: NUDIX domain-containing protein [Clostridia bacterium]|nr:NUDIX domain-containing protein [Clostridia bacterium]
MTPKHDRYNDSYGAIAFAERNGQRFVLMVQSRKGWSFPKGHWEKGESPAQCAERETFEETGVRVRVNTAFVSVSPDANGESDRNVYFFIAESPEGPVPPQTAEVPAVEWVPEEDAAVRIGFAPDRDAFLSSVSFLNARKNAPEPKHILICAERHTGKTTLLKRLLAETDLPRYGYFTKSTPPDAAGYHDIHLYPADLAESDRVQTEQNRIGRCDTVHHLVAEEVFNTTGATLVEAARPGGIIVMDELGFMERNAETFKSAVRNAFSGDIPVLGTIKSRYDIPFLNELRAMPRVAVYDLTEENRDALYEQLRPVVRALGK